MIGSRTGLDCRSESSSLRNNDSSVSCYPLRCRAFRAATDVSEGYNGLPTIAEYLRPYPLKRPDESSAFTLEPDNFVPESRTRLAQLSETRALNE